MYCTVCGFEYGKIDLFVVPHRFILCSHQKRAYLSLNKTRHWNDPVDISYIYAWAYASNV
jgi:hypothetical protein